MIVNKFKVNWTGKVTIASSGTISRTVEGNDYLDAVTSEGGTITQTVMDAIDLTFDEWRAEPGGDASVLSKIDHLWLPATQTIAGTNVSLIYNIGNQVVTQSGAGTPTYTPDGGYTFDGNMGLKIFGLNEEAVNAAHGQYHTILNYLISKCPVNEDYIYVNNTKNDLSMEDSGGNMFFQWSQGNNTTRAYPTLPAFIEVGNSRNFANNNYYHWRINGVFVEGGGRFNLFNGSRSSTDYIIGARNDLTPQYQGPFTVGAFGFAGEWYHSSDATLNAEYQRQATLLNTGIQRIMTALGR